MAEKQNQYEAMFLIATAAAPDADAGVKLAQGIIERHGGKIIVIKKWDERKLAYELRGQKRGMYVIAFFTAPGKAVTGIEREVTLSEEVLRVLITRADHLNKTEMEAVEPQPIQPREERAPWDRPDFNRPMHHDRGHRDEHREEHHRDREPAGAEKE